LTVAVLAQDLERPYSILVFRGINNSNNELIPPEQGTVEAEECLNFDLGQTVGVLNKRPGYKGRYKAGGYFRGLFGYRTNSGKPRLFGVDSSNGYFDEIRYSAFYKSALGTTFAAYLFQNATPRWAVWDDILILMNGKNPPWRWNGTNWRPLVNAAPGMFEVTANQYNVSSTYCLNGDYYYAIQNAEPCSCGTSTSWSTIGQITGPVHIDSGMAILYYWPHMTNTDICSVDSSIYRVLRTRADRTAYDSFFVLATHRFLDTYDQGSLLFQDSTPDVSLSTYAGKWDTTIHTADTTCDTFYHVGQPTWLGTTTGGGGGVGRSMDTLLLDYYRYGICWYDSSTGMTSPMSPIARIPDIEGGTPKIVQDSIIQLGVYIAPTRYTHLWRVLYRAREYKDSARVADSTYQYDWTIPIGGGGTGTLTVEECVSRGGNLTIISGRYFCRKRSWTKWWEDQINVHVGPYYPVDTIKDSTTTTYNDTISWMTLESRDPYLPIIPTGQWNYPTIYQNRLFAAEGSKVYFTAPGKIAQFENYFPVGLDDGSIITAIRVVGEDLLLFKTNSVYKAVWAGDGYEAREFISGLGCIAPGSVIDFPDGGFGFLSYKGYQAFSGYLQSPYKESGGNLNSISQGIQNHLDKYSLAALWECWAWWTPGYKNLYLSFPTLDTSWVYASNGMGWSGSTFAFRQTTEYDTTYSVRPQGSVDIIGIRNASDSIYNFGDSVVDYTAHTSYHFDKGDSITASYKTRPLFKDYWLSQITDYALWIKSDESAWVKVYFYDHNGTAMDTITDSTGFRYRRKAVAGKPMQYGQIKIETKADSCAIQGLDIWIENKGEPNKY
jgi:hypothetical protein